MTARAASTPAAGAGVGRNGYATSIVLAEEQRGPVTRPRSSVSGVSRSGTTTTSTSASDGGRAWGWTSNLTMRLLMAPSQDQHRVAVAEEAVFLRHRRPVRPTGQFDAGQRADQQQQARPRQVEVGHQ